MTNAADFQDCGPEAIPAYRRLADRLDEGESPVAATDHMTAREKNHLSRLVASCRPLEAWLSDYRASASAIIRGVCE